MPSVSSVFILLLDTGGHPHAPPPPGLLPVAWARDLLLGGDAWARELLLGGCEGALPLREGSETFLQESRSLSNGP